MPIPKRRERIEDHRVETRTWAQELPAKADEPADTEDWFAVDDSATVPTTVKTLEGPWAEGVDAKAASLTKHQTLKAVLEDVLLSGDGKPLAMSWIWGNFGEVLIVANGSFLLNEPLAHPARRPWP